MNKYCIILCGGGGKTTLFNKYPHKFVDIDYFIWNRLKKKKLKNLENYIEINNIPKISEFYKFEMINNEELRNDKRIILTHHPNNSDLLNRNILGIYRPIKDLHEKNIKNRYEKIKILSRNDWNNLTKYNYTEFNNYNELENLIFQSLSESSTSLPSDSSSDPESPESSSVSSATNE